MAQSLINQAKSLTAVFLNISGEPVDPSAITLNIYREWQGVVTLVHTAAKDDMQNPAVGMFTYLFTPGAKGPGLYTARWTTGEGVDKEESWAVSAGVEAT